MERYINDQTLESKALKDEYENVHILVSCLIPLFTRTIVSLVLLIPSYLSP